MIAWKYIDKSSATVSAIRDYNSMRDIINITPQDIKDLYDRMVSPRSGKMSHTPRAYNPGQAEEMLTASLDKLDAMQERYRLAIEYMSWFEPAWGSLTDNEQTILREYYMGDKQRSGASIRIQERLNFSASQVERLRHKALTRLSVLLLG